MKTTEAIKFFAENDVTDDQGYNILIEDLEGITQITKGSIADPMPQQLIRFFMYQIQSVLFPVIRDLRELNANLRRAGQEFKDELDLRDKAK